VSCILLITTSYSSDLSASDGLYHYKTVTTGGLVRTRNLMFDEPLVQKEDIS
jgi:hypothetical protein